MITFLQYLEQREPDKSLVVFDFDGTIFRSPDKQSGEQAYRRATGKDWPHKGWWGRTESLMPPVVPLRPDPSWYLDDVVRAHKRHSGDPHSRVVLMTGRHAGFKQRVLELLDNAGIHFDDAFFQGQSGGTFENKANNIARLLADGYSSVEVYEDRTEHAAMFADLLRQLKTKHPELKSAVVHDVTNNRDITI